MTQVGTGVSQVLPILVMCLLAESDSTLVFEQPELHLHPNMQAKLADFFLSMALLGKQCIVETHSEHIVNQICHRYASEKNDILLQDKTKIYFCEKQGDTLTFNGITVNKYGALSQWPKDFFDTAQILTDKIIDAASEKIEVEEEGGTGND
jgi:predicted ATPase